MKKFGFLALALICASHSVAYGQEHRSALTLVAQGSTSITGKWLFAPEPETMDKGKIKEILKLDIQGGGKEIKGSAKKSDGSRFAELKGESKDETVTLEFKRGGSNAAASKNDDSNKLKVQGKKEKEVWKFSDADGGKYLMQKDPEASGLTIH